MTLLASNVILHARDLHPSLSAMNAPNPLAFRALTRMVDSINEEIARRVPGFLETTVTGTFPLASFTLGLNLTTLIPLGWKDLGDLFVTYTASSTTPATTVRASFVPYEQRDMNSPLPTYTLINNSLIFLGSDTDYAAYSAWTLTFTPLGVAVAGLASVIGLPDDALEPMALGLAAFFLQRLVDDPQYRVTARTADLYASDAKARRSAFLTRIWRVTQRQNFLVRDVMSGR